MLPIVIKIFQGSPHVPFLEAVPVGVLTEVLRLNRTGMQDLMLRLVDMRQAVRHIAAEQVAGNLMVAAAYVHVPVLMFVYQARVLLYIVLKL